MVLFLNARSRCKMQVLPDQGSSSIFVACGAQVRIMHVQHNMNISPRTQLAHGYGTIRAICHIKSVAGFELFNDRLENASEEMDT